MRRTPGKAQDYARRHGVPRWSDDPDEIICASDIDAVYVATRPDSHLHYTLRCADAGKPVYVEKPMSLTYEQSSLMIDQCAKAQVPLWVGYYRRALPRFLEIKRLLETGAIGCIRGVQAMRCDIMPAGLVEAPWQMDPTIAPGGPFFDSICHFFDLIDYLLGPIVEVHGMVSNESNIYPVPDTVSAAFRCHSGLAGSGLWCFSAGGAYDSTTIVGSHGRITFPVHSWGPVTIERGTQTTQRTIADPSCVHLPMIQTIVDELNGDGLCESTGVTAARTSWVMDQILGLS